VFAGSSYRGKSDNEMTTTEFNYEIGSSSGARSGLRFTKGIGDMTRDDRIEELIDRPLVIARTFDAPLEHVWRAWTERARLMQWFGPKGFKMPGAKIDFRPGGTFHYCLESPNGDEMWGKFVYREINAAESIVFVSSFSDEDGGLTRHPLSPDWPLEMLSAIEFAELDGRTTVKVQWIPLNATEAERKVFEGGRASMQQGWSGTMDQLADYLTRAQG
jgi:uncharacterized protein YndB with AHSA1/START domain